MRFLLPTGIGDTTWALTKAAAIAGRLGDGLVVIAIACDDPGDVVQVRALEYVRRFPFVASAEMYRSGAVLKPGPHADARGRYRYLDDGPWRDGLYALMPNAPLERGERLESWFPDDPIDWTITRQWANTAEETQLAATIRGQLGPFAVIYPGPEGGNLGDGHNRGSLWRPAQWAQLAVALRGLGLAVVAIGASYDWSYWRNFVLPALKCVDPSGRLVHNFVGELPIGKTLALIRAAALGVYYQSGLGVWSAFEGIPTAMFWRPEGNSICAGKYLSFDERMATAWVPPAELDAGRYLPCIYTRTDVPAIAAWAQRCASNLPQPPPPA